MSPAIFIQWRLPTAEISIQKAQSKRNFLHAVCDRARINCIELRLMAAFDLFYNLLSCVLYIFSDSFFLGSPSIKAKVQFTVVAAARVHI
jgi:hypothetical protein